MPKNNKSKVEVQYEGFNKVAKGTGEESFRDIEPFELVTFTISGKEVNGAGQLFKEAGKYLTIGGSTSEDPQPRVMGVSFSEDFVVDADNISHELKLKLFVKY